LVLDCRRLRRGEEDWVRSGDSGDWVNSGLDNSSSGNQGRDNRRGLNGWRVRDINNNKGILNSGVFLIQAIE
jgi:hypothetical protein